MADSDRDKWNSLPPFPKTPLDGVTLDISQPNYTSYATPLLLVFFHHVTLAPNVATKKSRSEFECVDIIDVRATSIDNEIPQLLFIVVPTRDLMLTNDRLNEAAVRSPTHLQEGIGNNRKVNRGD